MVLHSHLSKEHPGWYGVGNPIGFLIGIVYRLSVETWRRDFLGIDGQIE